MSRDAIPPGTLQLLILRTLSRDGEMHGFEIAESIQRLSNDVLTVEEGSLYPALQKLLIKGWVKAAWRESDSGRQVREYRITASGRRQLEDEMTEYRRMSSAIDVLLREA
jgi:PadR family transcriptional regulator PadR